MRARRPTNVHIFNRIAIAGAKWHVDRRHVVKCDGRVEGYYGGILRDVFGRPWIISRVDENDEGTLWKPDEVSIEKAEGRLS